MTLKTLRKKSGLKANKIAEELQVSRVQLYNIEKGKYKINKFKIKIFAELYKVSEQEIIEAWREKSE